jgi:hypothetical protein
MIELYLDFFSKSSFVETQYLAFLTIMLDFISRGVRAYSALVSITFHSFQSGTVGQNVRFNRND